MQNTIKNRGILLLGLRLRFCFAGADGETSSVFDAVESASGWGITLTWFSLCRSERSARYYDALKEAFASNGAEEFYSALLGLIAA